MTLVCGQSSNPCGKSVLYFINLISQMDDIQGVSARTVGRLCGGGGSRPIGPTSLGYGPGYDWPYVFL